MSGMQLRKYFVLTLKDEREWEKGERCIMGRVRDHEKWEKAAYSAT